MTPRKARESIEHVNERGRAEYDAKTKGLNFTKDFYSRQEALMRDPLATVGERVMAWILRRSWGEYSLYAIRDDGEPAYQRDCARELGLNKTSVSHAISYFQTRGYLEDRPKLLYPVISPVLVAPNPKKQKVAEYATFLANWKVANSANFQKWEDARSTIKFFQKLVRSEYKKSRKRTQKAPASLLEIYREESESPERADSCTLEAPSTEKRAPAETPPAEPKTPETPPLARDLLFTQIERMQKAYPDSSFAKPPVNRSDPGDKGLVDRILKTIGNTEERIIGFAVYCAGKFKGIDIRGANVKARAPGMDRGPNGVGLLVSWAEDYKRSSAEGGA